jgi:cytosine/creatinine deaminase
MGVSEQLPAVRIAPSLRNLGRDRADSVTAADDWFTVEMAQGKLTRITPCAPPGPHTPAHMLLPTFVDLHVHLDKTFVVDEVGASHGDLFTAIERMAQHRDGWSAGHIHTRMERALREAYAHGTRALRTHLDWMGAATPVSLGVFESLRNAWRDKLTLQCVSLTPIDVFADAQVGATIARTVAAAQANCDTARGEAVLLGAFVYRNDHLVEKLTRVFQLAASHGLHLDFHVDEGLDADARGVRAIAELTLQFGYEGKVTCGHACSLSMQTDDEARDTLRLCAKAGIHLVSLPSTNLYLQGAWNRTPVERGITRLQEAADAGMSVSLSNDNVADGFYPYGSYALLPTWAQGVQLGHLKTPMEWLSSVTTAPARAMHLPWNGCIHEGCDVSQVLLVEAADARDLMNHPPMQRLSAWLAQ